VVNRNSADNDDDRWSIGLRIPRPWRFSVVFGIGLTILIGLYAFASCDDTCTQYFSTQIQKVELTWLWARFPLPILGVLGIWLALKRFRQTDKSIGLQMQSRDQQRFFDATKLLDTESIATKSAALIAIKKMAYTNGFEFADEAIVVLKHTLEDLAGNAIFSNSSLGISTIPENSDAKKRYTREHLVLKNEAFFALSDVLPRLITGTALTTPAILRKSLKLVQLDLSHLDADYFAMQNDKVLLKHIKAVHFFGCRMTDCKFPYAVFENVVFGRRDNMLSTTDLTGSDFSSATFHNSLIVDVNISGVIFREVAGLEKLDLFSCIYDFDNPPLNLPPNLVLSHPKFRVMKKEPEWYGIETVELDESCIPEFCEMHQSFRPHDHSSVITV